MKVAIVSTYPPRKCGIATFAKDVRDSLRAHTEEVMIVASVMRREAERSEVMTRIRQGERSDYSRAATIINRSGADVVLVQHEFGIFGGAQGAFLLDLLRDLDVPYCVTLHTVLEKFTRTQASVMQELCDGAALVFVFSSRAKDLLAGAGLVDPAKVAVIPHGAPLGLIDPAHDADLVARLSKLVGRDTAGRPVMSTFGLLSPGKGLEHAIEAIPAVLEVSPDVLYVVAGRTHPEIVKRQGETYRGSLEYLVEVLGIEDNVVFVDKYLSDDELVTLLRSSQVFVTPYPGREQVVSGTLSFAVAAGCAVVSTPYYHAEDLAESGAVVLVDFGDTPSLARGIASLLGDPEALARARAASHGLAAQMSWDVVGQRTARMLELSTDRGMVTA
ncbi:glycosyltransferase [Tessaracoccus antarcticus]|uniref:Glycosyltransferase n=1 Tax=Tessaracoccus antarcticus TaxID=2479848 RepID=A0A3M0G690_9ACTN|nr:glycosyltransferase [Tessaracoccus antarcticus]RMB59627.1 glycosyltransferase [Tessaracoccus antarcticus]